MYRSQNDRLPLLLLHLDGDACSVVDDSYYVIIIIIIILKSRDFHRLLYEFFIINCIIDDSKMIVW